MSRRFTIIVLSLIVVLLTASSLSAQAPQLLTPENAEIATLSEQAPINVFSFSGSQGDLVQIRLVGIQSDMNLTASLQSPSQQNAGVSTPSLAGEGAYLSAILPETGVYTVLVGGNHGNYLTSFRVLPASDAVTLTSSTEQAISLDGTILQAVNFSTSPTSSTALTISAAAGTDYQAALYDGDGALVSTVQSLTSACFLLESGDSTLTMFVGGLRPEATSGVNLTLGDNCGSSSTVPVQPVTSPVVPQELDPTICTAVSASTVNVRSGAGTNYSVISTLTAGVGVPALGVTSSDWVQVQTSAGVGFVSRPLVTLAGPCANLPVVSGDPGQQPQPTQADGATVTLVPGEPTATYTATVEGDTAPTPTYTATIEAPTATDEAQATPTATPPQEQIAPPDSNYALVVPLDGSANLSDYVSYPNGDVEDLVSYSTSGLNPSTALPGGQGDLSIALSCFGTGTEYIVFRISGRDYTCGQTFTRRVTFDSHTGGVRIIATGGQGTYVQWSLAASLARAN